MLQSQAQYSYLSGFKESVISFLKEIYKVIRGSRKKNSYYFPGWTTSYLKRPYIYSYISKIGKKQNELQGADVVVGPEGTMESLATCESVSTPAWSLDPVHVRKLLTREPGDPASGLGNVPRSAL